MRALCLALTSLWMAGWPGAARALDPDWLPSQYVRQAWTSDSGLPQNSGFSLAQASDGRLAVGTEEGLAIFDGFRFDVVDRWSAPALRSTRIRAVLAVGTSFVFTTLDGQVCVATLVAGRTITCAEPRASALVALATRGDAVYAGGPEGLFRVDIDDAGTPRLAALPCGHPVTALSAAEGLWVGTPEGVFEFDDTGCRERASTGRVLALLSVNRVLYAGGEDRLARIEGAQVSTHSTLRDVRALAVDRDGVLWVGASDGLYRSRDGETFERVEAHARVLSILEDHAGGLVYGTAFEGVRRLSVGAIRAWGEAEGFVEGPVHSVSPARVGGFWVASSPRGLERVDFDEGRVEPVSLPSVPPPIVSAVEDAEGNLHVAGGRGVYRVNPDGTSRLVEGTGEDRFVDLRALPISIDPRAGVLASSAERGLLWIPREGAPVQLAADAEVATAAFAANGDLWVGTRHGVSRGPFGGPFVRRGLDVSVYAVLSSEGDAVWLGTERDGLFWLDGEAARGPLTRANGLPDDTFFSLLRVTSAEGDLLVSSSNRGISVVQERTARAALAAGEPLSVRLFGARDGMRASECNGGSPASLPEGIFYPTIRGVAELVLPLAPLDALAVTCADARGPIAGPVDLPGEATSLRLRCWSSDPLRSREAEFVMEEDGRRLVGSLGEFVIARRAPGVSSLRIQVRDRDGTVLGELPVEIRAAARWEETTAWKAMVVLAILLGAWALSQWRLRALRRRAADLEARVGERTAELARQNQELGLAKANLEGAHGELLEKSEALSHALDRERRLQGELIAAERAAEASRLVSGVAHELNNPIGFIHGNVPILRRYVERLVGALPAEEQESNRRVLHELPQVLDDVAEGARRARLIVDELQAVGERRSDALGTVSVSEAAESTLRLLGSTRVPVRVVAEEGVSVRARAGQFEQVLRNVLDNALFATNAGEVTLEARREGDLIVVRIRDTGMGMSKETLARATEAFFTTKEAGAGSGLGLAIAQRIVSRHQGTLTLTSEVGKGTEVLIRWPSA